MAALSPARDGADGRRGNAAAQYAVVHVVAQEMGKDLIGPQVVDHMAAQAAAGGSDRPARVVVAFLEPARVALTGAARARAQALAERAPGVRVVVLPYSSRAGQRASGWLMARRLRGIVDALPVAFHCRGTAAVEWALALAPHFARAGIVADVRGAVPEETLFAHGYDAAADADDETRWAHDVMLAQMRSALAQAGPVLAVSAGLLDWLEGHGVERERLLYVPCCVTDTTFSPEARERTRRALGLEGKLVLAYLGTITRYQHVEDGVAPFFRAAAAELANAHLLCVTNDVERMRGILAAAGIADDRVTVIHADQRDVAAVLSGGDAGLLLRAPSRLNRYSQPTKVGEYLAAGLPLVVSRGTGRVDRIVEEHGAGVAVECFDVSEAALRTEARRACDVVRANGAAMRHRAIALCEAEFRWGAYVPRVREAYRRSLGMPVTRISANPVGARPGLSGV